MDAEGGGVISKGARSQTGKSPAGVKRGAPGKNPWVEGLGEFLSSPLGLTVNEAARQALGLPPVRAAEKIAADGRESADRVRERMDQDRASPYKVLGLDRFAEEPVVRAAWKALARRYHPDKAGGSVEKMKAINEAYSWICKEQGWKE